MTIQWYIMHINKVWDKVNIILRRECRQTALHHSCLSLSEKSNMRYDILMFCDKQ